MNTIKLVQSEKKNYRNWCLHDTASIVHCVTHWNTFSMVVADTRPVTQVGCVVFGNRNHRSRTRSACEGGRALRMCKGERAGGKPGNPEGSEGGWLLELSSMDGKPSVTYSW